MRNLWSRLVFLAISPALRFQARELARQLATQRTLAAHGIGELHDHLSQELDRTAVVFRTEVGGTATYTRPFRVHKSVTCECPDLLSTSPERRDSDPLVDAGRKLELAAARRLHRLPPYHGAATSPPRAWMRSTTTQRLALCARLSSIDTHRLDVLTGQLVPVLKARTSSIVGGAS